jgi:hypothetical protein
MGLLLYISVKRKHLACPKQVTYLADGEVGMKEHQTRQEDSVSTQSAAFL